MIEKILIISLLVYAVWYAFLPGEIFAFIAKQLDKVLPEKLRQPIYDCPVCMAPWHGTYMYWLIPWEAFGFWPSGNPVLEWIVTVIAAMGLNAIINKMFPEKEE